MLFSDEGCERLIYPWNGLFQMINAGFFADRIWVKVACVRSNYRSTCVNANFTSGVSVNRKTVQAVLLGMVDPNRVAEMLSINIQYNYKILTPECF